MKYWFHSGNEFTTQADWTEFDNKIREQACIKDRSDALSENKSGKYTYGPTPGPDPCGKLVWLCNGEEYNSESDYKVTSCGAPPATPPPPPAPSYCSGFEPHIFCGNRLPMSHALCTCS